MASSAERSGRAGSKASARGHSGSSAGASAGLAKSGAYEEVDDRLTGLVRTIEHEVIPRLVRAHRSQALRLHLVTDTVELGPVQVAEFCTCVIEGQQEDLLSYIRATRDRGVSLERVYLELLAPVARRLGDMWMADECDFTAVTLALSRLHSVVHQLSAAFQFDSEPLGESKRVLLAAAPGEQHMFGVFMVAEFMRRAGWDVDQPVASVQELAAAVRRDWFAVAGFSLARESGIDALAGVIREVRRSSRNRSIGIIVGGVVFAGRPELVARVGADDWAADAPEAVRLADAVMARHKTR